MIIHHFVTHSLPSSAPTPVRERLYPPVLCFITGQPSLDFRLQMPRMPTTVWSHIIIMFPTHSSSVKILSLCQLCHTSRKFHKRETERRLLCGAMMLCVSSGLSEFDARLCAENIRHDCESLMDHSGDRAALQVESEGKASPFIWCWIVIHNFYHSGYID